MLEWKKFDKDSIESTHGTMELYRDLYEGNHAKLFERSTRLIEQGEIIDNLRYGQAAGKNITTPYIVLNICKMIVDIPALFVSRAIGDVKTNFPAKEQVADEVENGDGQHLIEGTTDDSFNGVVIDAQQELLDQITDNSNINHRKNLTQLQVDGGIVAVPQIVNGQIKIEIKERNVYYPHDDGKGYDLVYELPQTAEEKEQVIDYVHIYTERETGSSVEATHRLFTRSKSNELIEVEDDNFVRNRLGLTQLTMVYAGRLRSFINYLPYNPTFINELGVSALKGMEGRQDEVNWTLTRTAQTFERNGKPRISVTAETMQTLRDMAQEMYGDPNKIDHRWLEIQEINEAGQVMQVHQIDINMIGDMTYIKDIVRGMLSETQTSEAAFDFTRRESQGSQSGIAKFYDLMISIMKAESIREEYTQWLKTNYENALWFANKRDASFIIEKPNITLRAMIPQPSKELADENIAKFANGVQSLEQTVANINPDKSSEWVLEELERIGENNTSQDSTSLMLGNQTLQNFMNNRDFDGTPLNEDGTRIETAGE